MAQLLAPVVAAGRGVAGRMAARGASARVAVAAAGEVGDTIGVLGQIKGNTDRVRKSAFNIFSNEVAQIAQQEDRARRAGVSIGEIRGLDQVGRQQGINIADVEGAVNRVGDLVMRAQFDRQAATQVADLGFSRDFGKLSLEQRTDSISRVLSSRNPFQRETVNRLFGGASQTDLLRTQFQRLPDRLPVSQISDAKADQIRQRSGKFKDMFSASSNLDRLLDFVYGGDEESAPAETGLMGPQNGGSAGGQLSLLLRSIAAPAPRVQRGGFNSFVIEQQLRLNREAIQMEELRAAQEAAKAPLPTVDPTAAPPSNWTGVRNFLIRRITF